MPVDLYVDYTMKKKQPPPPPLIFVTGDFFKSTTSPIMYLNMVMFWVDLLNMDSPNRAVAR